MSATKFLGRALSTMILTIVLISCDGSRHSGAHPARELNFYNWASYIDPTVIADFEKETGIKVRLATYPSQEALQAVLLVGHSQYDAIVVSSDTLEHLAGTGIFRQLDRTQLPNWKNLDELTLARLELQDPHNRFAVPYLWGTTGIAINVTKIKQVAPTAPLDSWKLLFDPVDEANVARCGIFVTDAQNDVTDTMLLYMGKDPNSIVPEDLEKAGERLMQMRRLVSKIESDGQINDLTSGEMCAELTWTAVVVQAKRRTQEVGGRSELRFVIPREGAVSFIDTLAVLTDAPHPKEAHQFIDFLMRGDIAARNANFTGGASPNRAAFPLIDPTIRDDPGIYPPEAVQKTLHQMRTRPADASRIVTRNWTRFRTGE